jgi:LmbE family N-acetylglucosaminyl deacetylase
MGGLTFSPFTNQNTALNPKAGTDPDKKLHVVCLGAHPGDPEFGCGGTLARYIDAGHSVTIIYLTRGEAGDPTKTFEQSAALRTAEAEKACALLKAKPVFAGQIDANTELNKRRVEEMTPLILAEKPDVVFTQWPVDIHPDHQVCGLLALTVWAKSGKPFDLYYYEVNTGSETLGFEPTDYVDISSVRQRKKQALLCHKTQDPEKVYDDFFKTMEDFRGLEAGVAAAEAFIRFKPKPERATLKGL